MIAAFLAPPLGSGGSAFPWVSDGINRRVANHIVRQLHAAPEGGGRAWVDDAEWDLHWSSARQCLRLVWRPDMTRGAWQEAAELHWSAVHDCLCRTWRDGMGMAEWQHAAQLAWDAEHPPASADLPTPIEDTTHA